MTYNDLKQAIVRKIDKEKDKVFKEIENASKCEDWQDIRDDITFIIQCYGSIIMIERLCSSESKFDEEIEENPEEQEEKSGDGD